MANDCLAQIQACAIRVARLGADGVPAPGVNNLYVSDALTVLTITPEMEAGEEITQKNGCGALKVNYKERDRIKRYNIELTLAVPDPELTELLAGGTVLTDGDAVGYAAPSLNTIANPNGVSIELWAKQVQADGSPDPDFPYAWWVFPRVYLDLGQRQFQNGAHESPFAGFLTENENWHNGPRNDWPEDIDNNPFAWLPSDELPTAECGYLTLSAS